MPGLATDLIHGADEDARVPDVMPPIGVSTTFRYDRDPSKLKDAIQVEEFGEVSDTVYSRLSHPNAAHVEKAIGKALDAHVVAYSSGLSAFFGLMTHYHPKVLALGKAYHGVHGITHILKRNYGLKIIDINGDLSELGEGDLMHLETPVNPESTVYDIKAYADKAHSRGAILLIDSTFAPPPTQDPFRFGADMVIHSASKYFGGHSDVLAGILVTKDPAIKKQLVDDRIYLGSIISGLDSFLLLRSLRTYELRVKRQSENATAIVKYLSENKDKFESLDKIFHGSLQSEPYVKEQHPEYYSPVFSITLTSEQKAKEFPSKLEYFTHATSLGGVESLVEWRAMSDIDVDRALIRVSVGVEEVSDLIEDLSQALMK